MGEEATEEEERFSMYGLKHRGISDTKGDRGNRGNRGNRGGKQDAAGHKSPTTTGRYDHDVPVVRPPRKR